MNTLAETSVQRPTEEATQFEKDVLYIHPSEHSNLALTSSPLDATFEQWRRVDLMVTSWIWNSMSKDIVEAFMFCASSRELWLAIQTRYGRSNGPMVYQLQREISTMSQQELSLAAYFTKVTKLWNELSYLAPTPKCTRGACTCGINKAITDLASSTQLMQFLMGLYESYNNERSQILMMDPLPDIEKAFSMVYSVEKQRELQLDVDSTSSHMACQLAVKENRRVEDNSLLKKKSFVDKKNLICAHCRKPGHSQDNCFQLHGVPDWYKVLNDKKKKGKHFVASVEKSENTIGGQTHMAPDVMAELLKFLQKNNAPTDPINSYANYVHFDEEFAVTESPCDICHKAKQSRTPFTISTSQSDKPFVLVHMDLWGPYTIPTISGCSYVLTLLDDHSRSLWTFLLKHKSQVPSLLKQFCTLVHTQFHASIQTLRSDNGSEFLNHECQTICQSFGIIHQTSCTYSPQQNGRVERKHKHLLNVARALLFHASVPTKFWGDAILTATFLINRTPTKLLNWATPYEKLHGHPLTYDHLRTFGSLCYATNTTPHKTKFHPRASKCIMLGYAMTQKAYKLYDLENHTVLHSRDVQFYESVLPFATSSASPNPTPLPIIPLLADHLLSPPTEAGVPQEPIPADNQIIPSNAHDSSLPSTLPVRRSLRQKQQPVWLNDFVAHSTNSSLFHCCNTTYMSFLASLSILQEPKSFSEAVKHVEWRDAMQAELDALEQNHTWRFTTLPTHKRPIGCKWVFKTKLRADGSVERYKARLVAKEFNQIEGLDYTDNFSLVAKTVTVRLFLTLAAARGWVLHQLDVNNAFLHGYLDEDIYMTPLRGTLLLLSPHDHCLFTKETSMGLMALLVYVDDILITAASLSDIQLVKDYLHSLFTIKDIGTARYFLGLEIARNVDGLYVSQTKYVVDIVKDAGLLHGKSASTPFPLGLKLSDNCGAVIPNPEAYHRLVGRLLYLGFTRPDISHSVQQRSVMPTEHRALTPEGPSLAFAFFWARPLFPGRLRNSLRDAFKADFVTPSHIRSSLQPADLFTKALSLKVFSSLLSKLGLVSTVPSPTCGGAVEYHTRLQNPAIVTEREIEDDDKDVIDAG
ncbi:UNVERIFIED_CONTAM: Retrovirus-related Pol polyprotein from transposon TNT 1-94 [Sesamum latifolium]|uniref:Retrovirus-related Pol polyprotein from transposon TNT 1-94 n=1 Tax=Sesamum latifolium TaxID=2727402 RepID=A0AAW2TBR3_9LAMI